jgi:hypothetical protein
MGHELNVVNLHADAFRKTNGCLDPTKAIEPG